MPKIRPALASVIAASAGLALTVVIAGSSPASAAARPLAAPAASVFPPTGYHAFTPQAPSWSFSDSHGSGSEQITYSSSTEAWGFKMSASFRAGIVGNVVENANLYCGGTLVTNYGRHTVAPDYQFHGSRGGINTTCDYRTIITISYQTNSGSGTLTAEWNWYKTLV